MDRSNSKTWCGPQYSQSNYYAKPVLSDVKSPYYVKAVAAGRDQHREIVKTIIRSDRYKWTDFV